MLPGMDGIDVCRAMRAESGVPIVMLTAKTDTVDVVLGLESGADDYIVKPFKPKELVARIRARLRRNDDEPGRDAAHRRSGDRRRRPQGDAATGSRSRSRRWSSTCWWRWPRKPRQVFTREVLLEQVWGYRHPADTRLVNVHVQRLRAKVEIDPEQPEDRADRARRRLQGRARRESLAMPPRGRWRRSRPPRTVRAIGAVA